MIKKLKNPVILIILFLILYFLGGITSRITDERILFPFSSFFLFNKVPQNQLSEYAVYIYQAGNIQLNEPVLHFSADGILKRPRAIKLDRIIKEFGQIVESGEEEEINRRRVIFEGEFMIRSVRYAIVRMQYKPIERFKTGKIDKITEVAAFNTEIPGLPHENEYDE